MSERSTLDAMLIAVGVGAVALAVIKAWQQISDLRASVTRVERHLTPDVPVIDWEAEARRREDALRDMETAARLIIDDHADKGSV